MNVFEQMLEAVLVRLKLKLGGGDPRKPFFYLAGPMSNLPGFNFAEFEEKSTILRSQGYNIVNPAELDHEKERRRAAASPDGSHRKLVESGGKIKTWAECLRRDIEVVAHENCVGVILLPGWEKSQGAQFETYVAYKLKKPLYMLNIDYRNQKRSVNLIEIDRRAALEAAGVED